LGKQGLLGEGACRAEVANYFFRLHLDNLRPNLGSASDEF
jgi:hypothetical protein